MKKILLLLLGILLLTGCTNNENTQINPTNESTKNPNHEESLNNHQQTTQEYNQELKIYKDLLSENLVILTDYTTDFFIYENLEMKNFLTPEYDEGKKIISQYIEEAKVYANENTENNVVVYVSISEISSHNNYYLYIGKFVSDKNLNDLEEKIVRFMRSDYAHEPMNEKSPRYDTEDIYNLALSENEEKFEVLASGIILSINAKDKTDISRLYPGET